MITGTEPEDMEQNLPGALQVWDRQDSVHSATEIALTCLEEVQDEEWFKALPQGFRRFDLKRMLLLIENESTNKVRRVKANLHIHFPMCKDGSNYLGAPAALAIAQVMRGTQFRVNTAAMGEVGASGTLVPVNPYERTITIERMGRLLWVRHEGDLDSGKPSVREDLPTEGFSCIKDMLIYAFDDEEGEVEE
jgi:hypothetical protein